MKRIATALAASMIGLTIGLAMSCASAYAATNVADCDAVMKDVNAGKSVDDIAKDQGISKRQIRTCEKKAKAAAAKASAGGEASPAASPAAPKP